MKIRIRDNSIRLRLTRSEVERFGKDKYIKGITEFGDAVFTYAMCIDGAVTEISADLTDNKITMHIPASIAETFLATDAVGFQNEQLLANGKKLFLLFEKDFKCMDDEVLGDQSDNYENPSVASKK